MSYFALLWKARTIEKYRRNYESEKIKSIMSANTQMPKQSLSQRWRYYRYDTQKRISRTFRKWYPEGSSLSNLFVYLKTDQTFPNFVLKSVLGFFGGIILTYLCFMFFVFQLAISLIHATIMSSIIGVLLTLGLAFSYRIRCLVFLLIPQFFSRVGRYTLTCYALVLILTGPATNTLKNSEVLSESLACGQEEIKTSVNKIKTLTTKPLNSLKDSITLMIDRLREVAWKMKQLTLKINRLVLTIAQVIQSGFLWLNSLSSICNKKLVRPYQRSSKFYKDTTPIDLKEIFSANASKFNVKATMCSELKFGVICVFLEHLNGDIVPIIKKRLRNYSDRIANMLSMRVHVHHSYSFSSNDSRSASQAAAGIVTEIRKRADPLLTWLSWSSCVTSLFLLLIIFRAKYYQHMFDTKSRFDNRYITKEIRDLDLKRLREGRETILPLNRRERAKYVTTTSFRLVASEKVYLNRSVVFMSITTFKLLIHMVADYSLYWVLMTIRYHGRLQTLIPPGYPSAGAHISGSGPTADFLKSILASIGVLLQLPASSPVSCLPNPHPPDFKRYTQIGVLIILLWFFAMFEPYGLRLRHVVMGHYQPERAKARADWLYSHILRTRGGFMKFARRKLHRMYKYRTEERLTFRKWINNLIPSSCLRYLLGTCSEELHCLLCGTTHYAQQSDTELVRCRTSNCPGVYCTSCFDDIGELCTICLSPKDYGDFSDVSLEKGSSDESENDDDETSLFARKQISSCFSICETRTSNASLANDAEERKYVKNTNEEDNAPLLPKSYSGVQNYSEHNNITIIKRALLVRHLKHSVDVRQSPKDESLFIYCEHFNKQNVCHLNNFLIKSKVKERLLDINRLSPKYNTIERSVLNDLITKSTKINRPRKKLYTENDKSMNVMKSVKKRNKSKNKTSHNSKLRHRKAKVLSNFTKRVQKIVPKSSVYNISRKGSYINVEKISQLSKREGKIKTNRKEISENGKHNSREPDWKKKKKQNNSNRKSNDDGDNEKQEIITDKSTKSTCCCFRKFRNLLSGFIKEPKIHKSSDYITNDAIKTTKPLSKDKTNHKRRKKKKIRSSKSEDVNLKSEDILVDVTRKYRISAYLAEQDWIKRQCNKKANDKTKITEISDAAAVINSTSKYKTNKKGYRKEINLNIVNKRLGTFYPEDKTKTDRGGKNIKVQMTFSDLWKRIGFKLLSGSSTSSFMENIFRASHEIFFRDSEKYSSSNIERRLQFYGSLGNDDFKKLENFKDDLVWGMESDRKENKSSNSIKKYPSQDHDLNHDASHCSTCTEDYRLCFDKYFASTYESNSKKKLRKIKRVLSDRVRSGYQSSISYLGNLICNRSKEKVKKDVHVQNSSRKLVDKNVNTTTTHGNREGESKARRNLKDEAKSGLNDYDSYTCLDPKGVSQHSSAKNPLVLLVASQHSEKNANKLSTKITTGSNEASKKDTESSCPCPVQKRPSTSEKNLNENAANNRTEPPCPCLEIRPQITEKIPYKNTIVKPSCPCLESKSRPPNTGRSPEKNSTTIITNDMKTGSNTSMNKKATSAEVQTEKKTENEDWVIAGKTANRTSAKEDFKNIVKKSIRKMKSANKEIQNVLSKSITKLSAHGGSSKPVARKSSVKISETAHLKSTSNESVKKIQDNVGAKSGSNKSILKKSGTGEVPIAVDKALATDLVSEKPSNSKGTQLICGCKSALELLKRLQNQSIQTKASKGDIKDTKSMKSVAIETKLNKTSDTKDEEPTSTETTDSSEEKLITKFITPSKKSKTSIQSQFIEPNIRSSSTKSVQSQKSKGSVHGMKKFSDTKRQSVHKVESDCPCKCVCSEAEVLDVAKETCTCATQYDVYYKDEKYLQEIFGCTSSSCSGSDAFLSSSISDPSITDCTICSLAYVDDKPKKRKRRTRISVITKTNQSTGTDKPRLCDVSTLTKDWWSPLVEKKTNKEITFDGNVKEICRKNDQNFIGDQMGYVKKKALKAEGRIVTFRSQAQIIPAGLEDILSPSRYLLESQWYYNELFSSKFYAPHLFPVSLVQRPKNGSKTRFPSQLHHHTRRNHKTKRLDECYSPRKQISPRKQTTSYEWIRSNENKNRYQRKILLKTNTRPNNAKKPKRSNMELEKIYVSCNEEKLRSNDSEYGRDGLRRDSNSNSPGMRGDARY